jgi:stringent starvation protein B
MTPAELKKHIVQEALDSGQIQISVNSTLPGVKVPGYLLGNPDLRLNLSWKFKTRLELKDWGIFAELSFNKVNRDVELPWESIWGFIKLNGDRFLFQGEIPQVTSKDMPRPTQFETISGGNESSSPPRTGHLRLLKN